MARSLYFKLLCVLAGFTLILAAVFLIVIRHSDTARNQEINQKLHRSLAARLANDYILHHDRADPAAVREVFDRIRVVNPRIDVYLLDAGGDIIALRA